MRSWNDQAISELDDNLKLHLKGFMSHICENLVFKEVGKKLYKKRHGFLTRGVLTTMNKLQELKVIFVRALGMPYIS